ncbi:MAG: DNA replication complex GINS family protein [Candidatus Nezhaarchaeota archaeon]|nr:DNA replication complex GINS family protein [Candidatus Nezhaarchaeota archaeon]
MLKELLNVLLRELHDEKTLSLPQSFYDKALSYVHSLKIRRNNEVSDIQRKIWDEEVKILERILMTIRKVRARKIAMEVMNGSTVEGLPPEEDVCYSNLRKAFEVAELDVEGRRGLEDQPEEKGLFLLRKDLDEATASKLGLPKLSSEDVIFINKRTGKVLIDLGLADEISVR